jgi:hypothetical protein
LSYVSLTVWQTSTFSNNSVSSVLWFDSHSKSLRSSISNFIDFWSGISKITARSLVSATEILSP